MRIFLYNCLVKVIKCVFILIFYLYNFLHYIFYNLLIKLNLKLKFFQKKIVVVTKNRIIYGKSGFNKIIIYYTFNIKINVFCIFYTFNNLFKFFIH